MRLLLFVVVFLGAASGCAGNADRCGKGTTDCDGACRDLDVDPANCGGCGNACNAGQICSEGTCGDSCGAGLALCDEGCVDLDVDRGHCGECGNACADGQFCLSGACETSCGALSVCDGACRDLQSDPANCGECDHACAAYEACFAGTCGCPAEFLVCGGACVDPLSDEANCGGCDSPCEDGPYSCQNGACVYDRSGVARDVPTADLLGWEECYAGTYEESKSVDEITADCSGAHLLLGCRPTGSDELRVAAHAPRDDVLYDTDTGNEVHVANGVGWYFDDGFSTDSSWGFAREGDAVNRNPCDGLSTRSAERLCWIVVDGELNPGARCGSSTGITSGWERVVYHRD